MDSRLLATPVRVTGAGWDVLLILKNGADNPQRHLCGGRGPYTLAQAQVAADSARRDAKGRAAEYFRAVE